MAKARVLAQFPRRHLSLYKKTSHRFKLLHLLGAVLKLESRLVISPVMLKCNSPGVVRRTGTQKITVYNEKTEKPRTTRHDGSAARSQEDFEPSQDRLFHEGQPTAKRAYMARTVGNNGHLRKNSGIAE